MIKARVQLDSKPFQCGGKSGTNDKAGDINLFFLN